LPRTKYSATVVRAPGTVDDVDELVVELRCPGTLVVEGADRPPVDEHAPRTAPARRRATRRPRRDPEATVRNAIDRLSRGRTTTRARVTNGRAIDGEDPRY
jgi:hypothetical protein